jgi:hypothetical protein
MTMTSNLAEPQKTLRANFADVQPQQFNLTRAGCTIGRALDCGVVLARPFASRMHADIVFDGHYFVLRDNDSANGTFVNGRQISGAHKLKHGDQIGFGDPLGLLVYLDEDKTVRPPQRLTFDQRTAGFAWDGVALSLTADQAALLLHLYERHGDVCPRIDCARAVWKRDYDAAIDAEALDQLLSRIRARLRAAAPNADELLLTVRGKGYLLKVM